MQDGTFITRVFVVAIIVMILYAGNSFIKHRQNLEQMLIDQQHVIDQQQIAIGKLRQSNIVMYQYILQQQPVNVTH